MSGVTPPASAKIMVSSPDFVVVARVPGGKPEVISDAAMVAVSGGARFAGNGYVRGEGLGKRFTFGVNAPGVIGVVSKSGQKRVITDATKVLFCGGTDPHKTQASPRSAASERDLSQLIQDHDSAGHSEIVDDEETHIVDNGATLEMADRVDGGFTDFDELVQKRNEALQASNGDEFAAYALLQENTHGQMDRRADWVRVNPVSALNGILGAQADCTPGGQLQRVVNWAADNDAEATTVTISIMPVKNLTPLTPAANHASQARPFARVTYGSRGFSQSVDVDVGLGRQITVSASSVVVDVGMDPLTPRTGLTIDPINMRLAAMLSFTPIMRTSEIVRTIYVDDTSGSTPNTRVPNMAVNLMLFRDSIAQALSLTLMDVSGTLLYEVDIAANTNMAQPIPLTGDVVQLAVTDGNHVTLIGANLRFVFGLSL